MNTNNKTLAVDALAVMDELIDFEERHAEYEPRQNHEAREARAAVAELIEEHRLLLDALKRLPATDGRVIGLIPLIGRSESALARVKGESA
ncbi:TPA: hypothetical protein UL939_000553 [Stenotrophomonas maltophilia]|uniref:Uncharacterized protein n=1 Tax=Stenotrophomonas maltophilia TaxID=40324 RepID=A0AA40YBF3_STEMA|nr:hypothetical protein [Stenotrophomonas sp. GD04032]AWB79597.1 hypothetical protein B7H26_17430 [Stenotrophomonas maltophilia]MDU4431559.1 hypothetical protein [Pluralibacter gergoviae]MBH1792028.1 hypothetical protein [Stenotrophomonas maltophilia]MDG9972965.1 hypothetical protein [Stenotrophomonas sp. GD04032]HEL2965708.1 hypothetical protein [Stenotrophomonas maltophilia]